MNPFGSNASRETKAFLNSQNIPIVVSVQADHVLNSQVTLGQWQLQAQIYVLYPTSHQWLDAQNLVEAIGAAELAHETRKWAHKALRTRCGKQTRTLLSSSSTYRWWYASKSFPVFQETRISDSVIVRPRCAYYILWPLCTYVRARARLHLGRPMSCERSPKDLKLWGPLGP